MHVVLHQAALDHCFGICGLIKTLPIVERKRSVRKNEKSGEEACWDSNRVQTLRLPAGLEKSGRLVAMCDQKIFLATRSQAAVVNLATNFSTKGPVWRPQFCALFHVRTNGTVRRPENERHVSENEIQNFENLSRYSRNVNLAHSHTPARPIPPPPPPFEYGSSFLFFFFW